MDISEFWVLVEAAKKKGGSDPEELAEALQGKLETLPAEEIIAFRRHLETLMARAYTWDLWGAAYVINGGCSDDGFEYFRAWLITRGRKEFEAALSDPESLASLRGVEPYECWAESFLYAPFKAYEEVAGHEMPETGVVKPTEPGGAPWREGSDDLDRRFPKLTKKFGG